DDGRPSETFIPRGDPKRRGDADDRPARREGGFKPRGDRPSGPGGFKKRFEGEDRPARREGGFKPRDDRPARRPGESGRPDTRRGFGNKPFSAESRGGDTGRPYRARPEGEGRPFRKDEGRPLARRTGPNKGDKAFG